MSRATPDDQLKFLLSCVRHSNNGKIDFVEVAKECGVVSKGAAAKRYERLLKANGIHPSGGPAERLPPIAPKQKSKAEIARSAATKRRKIEGDAFDDKIDDEDDFNPFLKTEPLTLGLIKPEPGTSFQSYRCQHMLAPSQPAYLPGRPILQVPMQSTYQSPFLPIHQQQAQARSDLTMLQPSSLGNSTTVAQSSAGLPTSQFQSPTLPRASTSVSEDQIQFMFDEFCSQDLYKQLNFDSSFSVPSQSTVMATGSETIKNESQLSPRPVEILADTSLGPQEPPTILSENMTTSTPRSTAFHGPTGSGIENSILIMD